jgi:hypothetical protein
MATNTTTRTGSATRSARQSTETKAAFKTTEFIAYVVVAIAVLVASSIADQGGDGGFGPRYAWLYVTILTVGYMLSRGLAKAGSREPYWRDGSNNDRG